jgi:hypothetical protein
MVQPAVHEHERGLAVSSVIPELKFQTIGVEEV